MKPDSTGRSSNSYKLDPAIAALPLDPELLTISRQIALKDASLWVAGSEAPTRLGWVDLPERSRTLLPTLDALEARVRERRIRRIVLSGMGGSSLAPEVIYRVHRSQTSRELDLLDSTEPHFVDRVVGEDLTATLFLISSKSGTTIETTSHLALIESRLAKAGLDSRDHIVVVSDPGSPLLSYARERDWFCVEGDPHVGGRFSALSAFGLAPAALMGVDASLLLDDAAEMLEVVHEIAVRIARYLAPHRYVYFTDSLGSLPGLADWIEQLIAESTGKQGKGILPIAISDNDERLDLPSVDLATIIDAPLGAHFILWEWVTALLGHILNVDPFDQPDVQATKAKTMAALSETIQTTESHSTISLDQVRTELTRAVADREYIAICAYLDPIRDAGVASIRRSLERRFNKPVAFGWGPRFLHSTGQFHKGGPRSGVFLSITISSDEELPVPGQEFGFERLIHAQAEGDRRALIESGSQVISAHLKSVGELQQLISSLS